MTATVTDLTLALRASVEHKIAALRTTAATEFSMADVLQGYANDHHEKGALVQYQVDRLVRQLGEMG